MSFAMGMGNISYRGRLGASTGAVAEVSAMSSPGSIVVIADSTLSFPSAAASTESLAGTSVMSSAGTSVVTAERIPA